MRHPILGRNEELRKFKIILQNAIEHEHERFTRYRDHKYAIAITVGIFNSRYLFVFIVQRYTKDGNTQEFKIRWCSSIIKTIIFLFLFLLYYKYILNCILYIFFIALKE